MALPVRKSYKGAPTSTTLSSGINNSTTSVAVAAVTGWPTTFPFYAVIDPGTAKEEKVRVTAIASTTLTVVRAQDDTTAVSHDASAAIYPVFTALEADEANQIASVMTTKGDIISTDGTTINRLAVGATAGHALVVDSAQTNGIKWGQVLEAGIADSAVTSAKIANGTIVNDDINASAAIALSKLATGALPTAITVASANIVNGTIATDDIADAAVTAAKVATAALKLLCPVGTIAAYGGTSAPTGWLVCNGDAISGTYTELIALVGANTPNLKGRVLVGRDTGQTEFDTMFETGGSKTHTLTTSEMPSHTHTIQRTSLAATFTGNDDSNVYQASAGTGTTYTSTQSAGSGSAHNNLQPYSVITYIIKHDY